MGLVAGRGGRRPMDLGAGLGEERAASSAATGGGYEPPPYKNQPAVTEAVDTKQMWAEVLRSGKIAIDLPGDLYLASFRRGS